MRFAIGIDDFTVVDEPRDSHRRAFCPGASPPDNSCSPSNKGTGLRRSSPSVPEPDGKASADDDRGASGHSAEQRRDYARQLDEWMWQSNGISFVNWGDDFSDESIIAFPPSMESLSAVARGIERLNDLEMSLPSAVKFDESLPPNAAAAYEFWSDDIAVPPDVDIARLERAVMGGEFAGTSADDLFVHEMSHADHFKQLEEHVPSAYQGLDKEAVKNKAHEYVGKMFGLPDEDGVPTIDPWTRSGRITMTARNVDGKPFDPDEAREIASEVSRYAMRNPLEFVAEVRTGASTGAQYSSEVMSLYKDYMGPPLVRTRLSAGRRKASRWHT